MKTEMFFTVASQGNKAYPWVEVLTSITSGTLVPATAFRKAGLMLEELFIDDVDAEWGHRARYQGLHLFGTSHAVLHHRLGEGAFKVWYLRWRSFGGYSPLRLYYRFRNFIALCKMRHVPISWKIRAGWYWLGNAYAFIVFSPNKWANARAIATGIWHGLRGRMGRHDFPESG